MDSDGNADRDEGKEYLNTLFKRMERRQQDSDELVRDLSGLVRNLSGRMERIERGQEQLAANISALVTTTSRMDSTLSQLHSDFHMSSNFSHRRLMALKNASAVIQVCTEADGTPSVATAHAVHLNGIVAMVTVAHNDCGGVVPPSFIHCAGYDLALYTGCPVTDGLLDIENVADIRLGDSAVAFGYVIENGIPLERGWEGTLVGKLGVSQGLTAFRGVTNAIYNLAEYFLSGMQLPGMSGGPAANGCGYLGLAHAKRTDVHHSAFIIPAPVIQECIVTYKRWLKTKTACNISENKIRFIPASPSCPHG